MSNCLQRDHVDYAYGAAKILFSRMSARISKSGKMYAITGPSGAGKSTRCASLLAGSTPPGEVRFEGTTSPHRARKHRREHVSSVFRWT